LLFNFLALQDPLRLLYVLCKSSSSYYWAWQRPKHRVFNQNLGPDRTKTFLICFIMFTTGPKTSLWS